MPGHAVDEVLDLVAQHAPTVLHGAVVDRGARTMVVPLTGGRVRVNLEPVLAEAGGNAPAARAEVVRRWLVEVSAQVQALADQPDPVATAPAAATDLRLQVMPGWDPTSLAPLVFTPVGQTFDALVVYPDPSGRPAYLTRRAADAHFGGPEKAVEGALQQTIAELAPHLQVDDVVLDGHPLRRLALPGYPFVPVVLFSLDRFLPGPSRGGCAVLVPSHDEVVLRSVDARADIDVVPGLSQLAREHHAASSLPFSPDVFWYLDGTYYAVEASPDGRVRFPHDLKPVLGALD